MPPPRLPKIPKLISEDELAERWDVKPQTLRKWRVLGKGPEFIRIDGAIRYLRVEIEDYEKEHKVKGRHKARKPQCKE